MSTGTPRKSWQEIVQLYQKRQKETRDHLIRFMNIECQQLEEFIDQELNRDKSEIVSDKTTNDIIRKELRRLDSTNEEFYNKI